MQVSPSTSISSLLSSDRPIEEPSADILHRADFARNIARIFREWKGRDSLVIALYGPWGAGKTSLKNLVLTYLKEDSPKVEAVTEVLHFNPWEWIGHDEITSAFFRDDRCITRAFRVNSR